MSPWETPLVREEQVRLEVEEEGVGGHRTAWQQFLVNILKINDIGLVIGVDSLKLSLLLLVSKVWLSFHVWRSRRFH